MQRGLSLSQLQREGWTVRAQGLYGSPGTRVPTLLDNYVMLACRATGADTLTLSAADTAARVFQPTSSNSVAELGQFGTYWYYTSWWPVGFAPVKESVVSPE